MFEQVVQERTFEVIVKQIKEALYSGELNNGDKLPTERELSKIFGTSRAAVRSAMLNLEQSGFINIKKGSRGGFFIKELDFKPVHDYFEALIKMGKVSVLDLTEVRMVIEPQVARLAARRADPDDLKKIEYAISTFDIRGKQELPPNPSDLDFHICVAAGAKNPVFRAIMQSLMGLLFESILPYHLDPDRNKEITEQHSRIFKAIKQKNEDKANTYMLEHVQSMRDLFK